MACKANILRRHGLFPTCLGFVTLSILYYLIAVSAAESGHVIQWRAIGEAVAVKETPSTPLNGTWPSFWYLHELHPRSGVKRGADTGPRHQPWNFLPRPDPLKAAAEKGRALASMMGDPSSTPQSVTEFNSWFDLAQWGWVLMKPADAEQPMPIGDAGGAYTPPRNGVVHGIPVKTETAVEEISQTEAEEMSDASSWETVDSDDPNAQLKPVRHKPNVAKFALGHMFESMKSIVGFAEGFEYYFRHRRGRAAEKVKGANGGWVTVNYPPTGAKYDNVLFPEHGLIVVMTSEGPQSIVAHHATPQELAPRPRPWSQNDRLPELEHWSDVTYLSWQKACTNEQRRNLKHIIRHWIINQETIDVIATILRERASHEEQLQKGYEIGRAPPWAQRLVLKPDTKEFDAMLSTPNVRGTAFLLAQHERGWGQKLTISSISVYWEPDARAQYLPDILISIGPASQYTASTPAPDTAPGSRKRKGKLRSKGKGKSKIRIW